MVFGNLLINNIDDGEERMGKFDRKIIGVIKKKKQNIRKHLIG